MYGYICERLNCGGGIGALRSCEPQQRLLLCKITVCHFFGRIFFLMHGNGLLNGKARHPHHLEPGCQNLRPSISCSTL